MKRHIGRPKTALNRMIERQTLSHTDPPSQKALMRSARKEAGKFTEGVILSKSMEVLFRAVPPSLYLAMAMTEPEEKHQRHQIMRARGIDELDAAFEVAAQLDSIRGIEPLVVDPPR